MENTQVNPDNTAAGGAAARVPRRGAPLVALLALFLAAGALLAGAWLVRDVRRVAAQADAQAMETQRAAVRLEAVVQDLSGLRAEFRKLAADESDLAERIAGTRAALQELAHARGNVDFALAEVEYLLILAEQRLVLMQDGDTASAALGAAQRRLEGLDAPGLDAVRGQMEVDQLRLRDMPRIDFNTWHADLGALADSVPDMPLRAGTAAPAGPATPPPPEGWRGVVHAIWQELRGLVVITRHSEALDPLPGEREALVKTLQLRVEAARLALLRRDRVALHAATAATLDWLTRWFDPTDSGVRSARGKLEALATLEPAPAPPEITSSLETLRALMRERATPGPLDAPESAAEPAPESPAP